MAVLIMARLTRHPKSRILYFRKVVPERLRARAGMREFKRSSRTTDARAATKWYAAQAAEYEALIERLEASPPPSIEAVPAQFAAVTPGDLHAMAGELWRWVLEHHAANLAPPEAFTKIAGNGPWGDTNDPWSGQRYQLLSARRTGIPAEQLGIVAFYVGLFLRYKTLDLAPEDHRAFCEAARDAMPAILEGDAWSTSLGEDDATAAAAKSFLKTMEGVN